MLRLEYMYILLLTGGTGEWNLAEDYRYDVWSRLYKPEDHLAG